MSLAKLNAELDDLYKFLWPPRSKGSRKKGGGDDPLRKLMNKEIHIFSMNATQLTTEIMQQGKRESANKQRDPHLQKEDKAMVTAFAKDLINGMISEAKSRVQAFPDKYRVKWSRKNVGLKLILAKEQGFTPYNALSEMRTLVGGLIEDKHSALFDLTGAKKTSDLVQVGHDVSVAAAKGAALLSSLEAHKAEQGEDTPFLIGGIDVTLDAIEQVTNFMSKHRINIEHYRKVKIVAGELKDGIEVRSTAEGADYNQILKANRDSGGGISEKDISNAIKELIEQIKERANAYYAQKGVEMSVNAETSRSMMEDMTNIILSTPKMKKVRKAKKYIKKEPRKIKTPKNFDDKAKGKLIKYKIKTKKDTNYLPLAAIKSKRATATASTENKSSLAPLYALLNAKLPRTVAENMGVPGLESRSGRFASSVRVTDVSRTAKGFPSVGYTYQRNPYQVFEMGVGNSSWATMARDPRKLIDASIREIAQELAVGRFYTRRV